MPEFARPWREQDADPDPIRQFHLWFQDAGAAGERAPEAAAVATATPDGRPSVRMVLVKRFDDDGFVFSTNHASRKGRELAANPHAALMFFWDAVGRSVRIEGGARRMTVAESEPFIRSRPKASQLSALASPQSQVVPSRAWLEQRVAELTAEIGDAEPPLPDGWGGFLITPQTIEFWQHQEDRLHDRLLYVRDADGWRIERLAP
jgi:pyridoxamine 5'-phosphate oxidase